MFLGRGSANVTEPRVRRGDPEVPWPELQTATDSPASAAAQRRLEQASARAKASPRGSAAAKAATSPGARAAPRAARVSRAAKEVAKAARAVGVG